MRVTRWWKLGVVVAVLWAAALPVRAQPQDAGQQSTGDPVADAARKARQEKKNAVKPKKVYTDDDVSKNKNASASAPIAAEDMAKQQKPAEQPADAATTTTEKAAGAPDDPTKDFSKEKNDEATWHKRFKAIHEKIAQAQKELDVLQRETQKAEIQYYPDPQKTMVEQYTRKDILDKDAKIAAKKQEIAKLQQRLSDLEDELRKAGGDPGWARE